MVQASDMLGKNVYGSGHSNYGDAGSGDGDGHSAYGNDQ